MPEDWFLWFQYTKTVNCINRLSKIMHYFEAEEENILKGWITFIFIFQDLMKFLLILNIQKNIWKERINLVCFDCASWVHSKLLKCIILCHVPWIIISELIKDKSCSKIVKLKRSKAAPAENQHICKTLSNGKFWCIERRNKSRNIQTVLKYYIFNKTRSK